MPQAASQSHSIPNVDHIQSSRVEAPVPFVKSMGSLWFWCHVAMWFAEIAIVLGSFANALSVERPSLRPLTASLWIERSIVASDESILIGSYLCLTAKILRFCSFGGFCRWAVAVGWLGPEENFCKMHVEQGAWHFPQMECCKHQIVDFVSMSPHLIPRIMLGNWNSCFMILFVWYEFIFKCERTLSTFPLLLPTVCNATWVYCGACVDIASHTIAPSKRQSLAISADWSHTIRNPKVVLLLLDAETTMVTMTMCWKRKKMLLVKTGSLKNPKTSDVVQLTERCNLQPKYIRSPIQWETGCLIFLCWDLVMFSWIVQCGTIRILTNPTSCRW